ncbi:MAG TPA: Wzz/FepE/Etk N-terminal domain-containing protein, partial [Sphingobium sp.]|nr:Wzz/FepE/Etk N-terminal domain-containing protein [Sphingobium sp.]
MASQATMIEGQAPDLAPQSPVASDLLRVLKRRRRLVIGSFLVTMLAAMAFLLVVTPRYQAATSVLVSTDDLPRLDSGVDAQGLPPSVRDLTALRQYRIDTQIELITSRAVARKVAYDLALFDDPEFFQPERGARRLAAKPGKVPVRMLE